MDVEDPDGTDAAAVRAPGLHAGVGQLSCDRRGAAYEACDGAGLSPVRQNFAVEDDVEVEGGLVFAEDQGSVGTDALCAVSSEPGVFGIGEAVELHNGAEGRDDLRQWRGDGGRRRKLESVGRKRTGEVVLIQG